MRNHSLSQIASIGTALSLMLFLAACGGGGYSGGGGGNNNPPPNTATLAQNAAKHSLMVGAAADSPYLSDSSYAATLGSQYNELTAENEMKFASVAPTSATETYTGADALVSFAQAHQMAVRGHTLVWYQQVPTWVTTGGYTSSQLSQILQDHITNEMTHFAGNVYAWDVVNEAFNDDGSGSTPATVRSTIWYDSPGIGFAGMGTAYIEQALNWARAADPNAKLFYNDYNIETQNPKSDAVYLMAQDFTTRNVPLDGIGFQFHINPSFDTTANLASVTSNLQRFAALGLDIHITELDIALTDSSSASFNAQAKLYGELATICLQQPKCKLFQTWGFTDKYSWIPGFTNNQKGWALPFDANYQKKPAYTSILNAWQ
jgi:endo-1,4-beta-xylanase